MSASLLRNQRRHQKALTQRYAAMLTKRGPGTTHCHKQIAAVAQGLAQELFEQLASDNDFLAFCKKMWPDDAHNVELLRKNFVAGAWGKMIPSARATMAKMLSVPSLAHLHEQISTALLLDNELRLGRGRKISAQSVIFGNGAAADEV